MSANNYTPIDDLIKNKTQPQPLSIMGGVSKESGPVTLKQESDNMVQEAVEHQPEKEVRPFVQPRAETIELPPDLKQFGLQPANTTQFPTYQNIKLPISDEKIIVGLHAPVTASIRWLATLAIFLLHKAHLGLKTIQGKVVRVIKY